MKIGIDLQVLSQQRTGIGNYAFNLSEALKKLQAPHEFIFLDGPKSSLPFWSRHISYAREIKKAKLDLFHGLANTIPLGLKRDNREKGMKAVITIHDLAIYKHPRWFPKGQWLSTKLVVPRSIKKADKIIVPSEATKADLQELFKVADSKIAVIPHGVDERFFGNPNDKAQMSKPYILFVGTIEPRKNVQRLIEAYEGLPESIRSDYELKIVGGRGWGDEIKALNGGNGVQWVDYVPYEELPALYEHASLFVYPSLYEGFGLPVLEAMAAGTPAIVSTTIVGNFKIPMTNDQPFETVDPYSVEAITEAMARVLTDEKLRGGMGEKGITLAKHFTWGETARKTVAAYESIRDEA